MEPIFHDAITPLYGLLTGASFSAPKGRLRSAAMKLDGRSSITASLITSEKRGDRFMQKLSRAALAMLLAMGVSGITMAANPPATGLGEAWPNAEDVSASPNWHVYVFVLNGVKYVQVNDLNGNVLGAIGTAGGQFITLPIGRFSQYVSTPQQAAIEPSSARATSAATTVYKDSSTAITMTPRSDGTMALTASQLEVACQSDDPSECNHLAKAL
jgi:hypothetical protein